MLVISSFLQSNIKPLVAKLIYDPNEANTLNLIVDQLTQLGEKIQKRQSAGTIKVDDFQYYNTWLKDFLSIMGTQDYIKALQGLHAKVIK